MANKENLPPGLATPPVSKISPSNKPALGRQRDHSACRVADTPLKVKKTRENLKQAGALAEIPPPCLHAPYIQHYHRFCAGPEDPASTPSGYANLAQAAVGGTTSPQPRVLPEQQAWPDQLSLQGQPKVQRQKSVSRRMLSRVKRGIASKSKSSQAIRTPGSETSLARRLSGRRKPTSSDADRRSQSFELSRDSIDSTFDDVSGVPAQRSFTDSTVSTSEILDDLAAVRVPSFSTGFAGAATEPNLSTIQGSSSPARSSPSPQPTPRPAKTAGVRCEAGPRDEIAIAVPCVELSVDLDCTSVDCGVKRDVWVAIEASVRLKPSKLHAGSKQSGFEQPSFADSGGAATPAAGLCSDSARHWARYSGGAITSLRLCYKPAEGCRIRNVVGQKSYKDLEVGQRCALFVRVGVPRMQTANERPEPDQESLFAELESIVGTLETDILHVEARYRHWLFPSDNVVAIKHTCKLLRPKVESRWSIICLYEKKDASTTVHTRLAQYLADQYAADEALELLHRYFDFDARARPGMVELCSMLRDRIVLQRSLHDVQQPEVVITDIDSNTGEVPDVAPERYDTAPSTPLKPKETTKAVAKSHKRTNSSSPFMSPSLAPPTISAARATTAVTGPTLLLSPPADLDSHDSHDSARQLWRHIRRTSLSARQLQEMTPERLSLLEAGDDGLKELRLKALANKRSIGAETLRTWKWEEMQQTRERPAEAPWM